jgi:hypothetical protein
VQTPFEWSDHKYSSTLWTEMRSNDHERPKLRCLNGRQSLPGFNASIGLGPPTVQTRRRHTPADTRDLMKSARFFRKGRPKLWSGDLKKRAGRRGGRGWVPPFMPSGHSTTNHLPPELPDPGIDLVATLHRDIAVGSRTRRLS